MSPHTVNPDPIPRLHPRMPAPEPARELPPAQINLFTGEPEAVVVPIETEPPDGEERIIDDGIRMVKTGDTSQVVLSGFGMFLSKKSERLLVRDGKKVVYEFPLFRLSEVVVASRGVTLSSDLIEELCQRGIRLSFLTGGGKPYAMLSSPMLTATVVSRREQLAAIADDRGVAFAKFIVGGKLTNQERLLRYFGKYLKQADPTRFEPVDRLADQISCRALPYEEGTESSVECWASVLCCRGKPQQTEWLDDLRATDEQRECVPQKEGEGLGCPSRRSLTGMVT
jgi:hypothetical protein